MEVSGSGRQIKRSVYFVQYNSSFRSKSKSELEERMATEATENFSRTIEPVYLREPAELLEELMQLNR